MKGTTMQLTEKQQGEERALREIIRQLCLIKNDRTAGYICEWIGMHYFNGDLMLRYKPEVMEADMRSDEAERIARNAP